jgi:hypothetical protein
MLVAEAKTKWCPFTRVDHWGTIVNRIPANDAPILSGTQCVANECMMWRWYSWGAEKQSGYCGLAARPEML